MNDMTTKKNPTTPGKGVVHPDLTKTVEDKPETKREKFIRLGNSRLDKALSAINVIANLANTAQYEFTENDVKAIVASIDKQRNIVHDAFTAALTGKTVTKAGHGILS